MNSEFKAIQYSHTVHTMESNLELVIIVNAVFPPSSCPFSVYFKPSSHRSHERIGPKAAILWRANLLIKISLLSVYSCSVGTSCLTLEMLRSRKKRLTYAVGLFWVFDLCFGRVRQLENTFRISHCPALELMYTIRI